MTRRIVNPQPKDPPSGWYPDAYYKTLDWCFWGPRKTPDAGRCTLPLFRNKYGQPGDRLWVRETWRCRGGREYEYQQHQPSIMYRADTWEYEQEQWRPSIFMPRWASRITLEIESVRVERLNAISAEDAIAEGIRIEKGSGLIDGEDCYMMTTNSGYMRGPLGAIHAYMDLWQSINGKGSWDLNPWVWVIQFKRLEVK